MLAAVACGGTGELAVVAQLEGEGGGEPAPLHELEIRAIPYDRDLVFDSLKSIAEATGNPEPPIPDSIMQMQTDIAAAQEEWSAANARWGAARDSLRAIREQMDRLTRGSAEYRLLFNEFGAQEAQEASTKRRADAAFARFDDLSKRFTNLSQELGIVRSQWADQAYAAVDTVFPMKLEASGREQAADTTDANGLGRFSLKSGQWWIHARYDLPFEELYWNVPVEVVGGEVKEVVLNRASAQKRPKF
jgi:hypothetical protein